MVLDFVSTKIILSSSEGCREIFSANHLLPDILLFLFESWGFFLLLNVEPILSQLVGDVELCY